MGEGIKKAAHFLYSPFLAYSPPNDAVVSALLELGYYVDLYAPGGNFPVDKYGPRVNARPVEYRKKWILKNLLSSRWGKYSLFSGTCEDPMAVVGALSCRYRRPSFTLADEIKSGSYYGNRPEIQTYKCGWWIADDKRALKDSLKEAINKSTIELKDMGKRGRKLIEDKYNCDYLTQRYIDLFSWAVNGGKLPQACLE